MNYSQMVLFRTCWLLFTFVTAGCQECMENYQCVFMRECGITPDFIYPCADDKICCLSGDVQNSVTQRRPSKLPENCGLALTDDKITGGKIARIGQFPWMALLGYKQKEIDFVQFLCGGTIISENYILTASHCLATNRLELVSVRLGELNLETEVDCEKNVGIEICANPHVDIKVSRIILHQNYNPTSFKNDIALIKLREKIRFSEYIRPICLPSKVTSSKEIVEQKFTVSGWGKTDSENVGGSSALQFADVRAWDLAVCNNSIPLNVAPVDETQLCANGAAREDACKGDSGGPLTNVTVVNGDPRIFQIGVVSFSSAQVCGNAELPTVYTKVDRFLGWINENMAD